MTKYIRIDAKLSDSQLKSIKKAAKNNNGVTLRLGYKTLSAENTSHELFLTTRQSTKLRHAINNNMSVDIKLSKKQIKTLIQSGGFLGSLSGELVIR